MSDYLSTGPVARELGVSSEQVRRWANDGVLSYKDSPLGRLFRHDDVLAFKAKREAKRAQRAARMAGSARR